MWISDKTLARLAKVLNIEVFQLFIPYQAEKNELNLSPASVLLELRQKILGDVDDFYTHIDLRINEALKETLPRPKEEETIIKKPVREKTKRNR